MDAPIYTKEGKKTGTLSLPENIFSVAWNADLVHQVVCAMESNARTPVAHTKDRSEVRGGGRKPWRQKGTGRARHGSSRSPIWAGGGVTFGPRNERNFKKATTKKMRIKALFSTLSKKYAEGEVLFLDTLSFAEPKTASAKELIAGLSTIEGCSDIAREENHSVLIALTENNEYVKKSFNNVPGVVVEEVRNLNVVDILSRKYLVLVGPEETIAFFESKISGAAAPKESEPVAA